MADDGHGDESDALFAGHNNIATNVLDEYLPQPGPESSRPKRNRPAATLGDLKDVPLELMQQVFMDLDIQTLVNFCFVNRRALEMVEGSHQTSEIMTLGEGAIRGMLRTGTAKGTTCREFYDMLCTYKCKTCGHFGGYIYLITFTRVCIKCLAACRSYCPTVKSAAIHNYALSREAVEAMPMARVPAGVFTPHSVRGPAETLVDGDAVREACMALYGSWSDLRTHLAWLEEEDLRLYLEGLAEAAFARVRRPKYPKPRTKDQPDDRQSNPERFAVACRMPFYDKPAREAHWAYHCFGCHRTGDKPHHWRKVYSVRRFGRDLKPVGEIIDTLPKGWRPGDDDFYWYEFLHRE